MDAKAIDGILEATLADRRVSRGERSSLRAVVDDANGDGTLAALIASRAFALASSRAHDPRDRELIEWLESIVQLVAADSRKAASRQGTCAAFFSPGESCIGAILDFIARPRTSLDVCVFTITDDRIRNALLDRHRRGLRVRIITDNEKSEDLGSDIGHLSQAGVPVAVDRTENHMHHKFAIADDALLLTGSFNWTRSASSCNEENLIVSDDSTLVREFRREFDKLWKLYSLEDRR